MQVLTVPTNTFGDFKYEIVCLHKFCYRQSFFFKLLDYCHLNGDKDEKKRSAAADLGLTV